MSKRGLEIDLENVKSRIENADKEIDSQSYTIDKSSVIDALNSALATEQLCVQRYKEHHIKAQEQGAINVADEFLEHANEEAAHAEQLTERISQLGGSPVLNPKDQVKLSHIEYVKCDTVDEMIEENLRAEAIAVEIYRTLVQKISNHDPVTRKLLESILEQEEEHLTDLQDIKAEAQQYISCENASAIEKHSPRQNDTLEESKKHTIPHNVEIHGKEYSFVRPQLVVDSHELTDKDKVFVLKDWKNTLKHVAKSQEENMIHYDQETDVSYSLQVVSQALEQFQANHSVSS